MTAEAPSLSRKEKEQEGEDFTGISSPRRGPESDTRHEAQRLDPRRIARERCYSSMGSAVDHVYHGNTSKHSVTL